MATNALLKSAVRHHNHGASNLARERLSGLCPHFPYPQTQTLASVRI